MALLLEDADRFDAMANECAERGDYAEMDSCAARASALWGENERRLAAAEAALAAFDEEARDSGLLNAGQTEEFDHLPEGMWLRYAEVVEAAVAGAQCIVDFRDY